VHRLLRVRIAGASGSLGRGTRPFNREPRRRSAEGRQVGLLVARNLMFVSDIGQNVKSTYRWLADVVKMIGAGGAEI